MGQQTPDGNTSFELKAAGLDFSSTSYDWLVVTGNVSANFKGSGNDVDGCAGDAEGEARKPARGWQRPRRSKPVKRGDLEPNRQPLFHLRTTPRAPAMLPHMYPMLRTPVLWAWAYGHAARKRSTRPVRRRARAGDLEADQP